MTSFDVFFKKLMHKAASYIRKPFSYHTAKATLSKLMGMKDKNEVIFLLRAPIGDSVYGMSAIDAYRQKYPDKKIVVIGSKKNSKIIKSYANVDRTILFAPDDEQYQRILSISTFPKICAKGAKQGVYMTLPTAKRKGDPDNIRQQRLTIFQLDENAPITYHGLTKNGGVTAIKNFEEIKEKVVVINPYSTTMPYVTMPLYEKLCNILVSRGYKVYTNVVGDQAPVAGSEALCCSIEELYSIACDIPLIVSVRSGILDLLVKSNINMFVLYENVTRSHCFDICRLGAWRCKGEIEEIYIENKKVLEQVPDRFLAYLERLGM